MKTRKSVLRRFKITKNGTVLRTQAFRRHLKAGKSKKRLRKLKGLKELTGYYAKKIRKVLGYG
ncbi:MAG: 50S ribosomal protein L35 [Patescibacteria group bacterium]